MTRILLTTLIISQSLLFTVIGAPPVTGLSNTGYMTVAGAERTPDGLVIRIEANPHQKMTFTITEETYITAGNEIYPVTGVTGIHTGGRSVRGEKGDFELCFGKIPSEVTSVDLVVSPDQGDYRIWDIDLTGNAEYGSLLPEEALGYIPDTDRELPEPRFGIDTTTVKIYLLGIKVGFDQSPIVINSGNPFTGSNSQAESLSGCDTILIFRFPQYATTTNRITDNQRTLLYLTSDPGEEIEIYLDRRAFSHRTNNIPGTETIPYVYFTGNHAGLNYEHNHIELNINGGQYNHFLFSNSAAYDKETTPETFLAEVSKQYVSAIAAIEEKGDMSRMMKDYARIYMSTLGVNVIRDIDMISRFRKGQDGVMESDPDILKFIYRFNPNEPKNIYSYWFGYSYGPLGEKALQVGGGELLTGKNTDYTWLASNAFPLLAKAERMEPLTREEIETVDRLPEFYRELYYHTDAATKSSYEQSLNSGSFVIEQVPDTDPADILEAIVGRYEGRVVFVDFWATWCGPCLNAMRTIRPLKPGMKEHDVAVIYITDESSPDTKWTLMLPEIGGTHYYLTTEQWTALMQRYGLKAIPSYLIFDKSGNLTATYRGFPGVETIRNEFEKIW